MPELVAGAPVVLATGLRAGPVEATGQTTSGRVVVVVPGPPGPASSLVIGDTEPVPVSGEQVLWLDTTDGDVTLNLVTGD